MKLILFLHFFCPIFEKRNEIASFSRSFKCFIIYVNFSEPRNLAIAITATIPSAIATGLDREQQQCKICDVLGTKNQTKQNPSCKSWIVSPLSSSSSNGFYFIAFVSNVANFDLLCVIRIHTPVPIPIIILNEWQ